SFELILLVLLLCIVFPLIITLPILALKKRTPAIFQTAFVILISILISLIVLPGLFKHYQFVPTLITTVTFLFSVLIATGYFRFPNLRYFFVFLTPAILVIPILFLSNPQIRKILSWKEPVLPHVNAQTTNPIVFIVFDEFPLTSLLNAEGFIDEKMYPNFARLARSSDWYRNATTVSSQTGTSIPAIVTGSMPKPGNLPTARDYPRNLFSLFNESHELNAMGATATLSPKQHVQSQSTINRWRSLLSDIWIVYLQIVLPHEWTLSLPAATGAWGNFAGASSSSDELASPKEEFESFLNSIHSTQRPTLYFLHSDLPHSPWRYLPDGRRYSTWGLDGMFVKHENWPAQESAATCAYQRHIIQVAFVDALIGKLISKLISSGLYEKSLVVITADHGGSFRAGDARRAITRTNYVDIIHIPLFIKKPFQKEGRLLDWNVETIDILPTVAEVLQVQIPWKVEGLAVSNSEPKSRLRKTVWNMHRKTQLEFDASSQELKGTALSRIQRLGEGLPIVLPLDEKLQVWMNATTREFKNDLSGKKVSVNDQDSFKNYDPSSQDIPLFVYGRIQFPDQKTDHLILGIAINGKICAITETFTISQSEEAFGSLIPEASLSKGQNQVQILTIPQQGDPPLAIPFEN
ncbi:sulfatase-like hydrolase/transferase, partial [bacterium]|nr:sulfatase-like hydrolase/transferase [bacterium]